MKIVCISDTHAPEYHNQLVIPECDLLIHAGDFSYRGRWEKEVEPFIDWFIQQPATHKVLICGNHEIGVKNNPFPLRELCKKVGIHFLTNEAIEIEGKKIFGSPYSVKFGDWSYGMFDDELQTIWDMIPADTEILITHGPAHGILDQNAYGDYCGSKTLAAHLETLPYLKLHIFGHLHESHGIRIENGVTFINASICGIPYEDLSLPIVIEL